MADGYRAYDAIAPRAGPMQVAHCWAHVRRKFFEIRENFSSPCETMLDLISEMYGIERELRSLFDPLYRVDTELDKNRLALRQGRSIAVIDKIKRFATETMPKTLPQSALRKAFEYMMGIWPGLTRFLTNPSIPLHNNHAERALRSVVVGRKNHYGSRSTRGLDVAAIVYSLVGTDKLAGVNPREYIVRAAAAAIRTPNTATLPWGLCAQAEYRAKKMPLGGPSLRARSWFRQCNDAMRSAAAVFTGNQAAFSARNPHSGASHRPPSGSVQQRFAEALAR